MSTQFIQLGNSGGAGRAYRTEPALRAGAEIRSSRCFLVGQQQSNDNPRTALLLGRLREMTQASQKNGWGVYLDMEFPHVMLIAGKRGSGKSYDLGILSEGLCVKDGSNVAFGTEKFAMVLFDMQNQFWTLCDDELNVDSDQAQRVSDWNLSANEIIRPELFRPKGTEKLHDIEKVFAIRPSDLEPADWLNLLELEMFEPMGQCLLEARENAQSVNSNYAIEDMIASVEENSSGNWNDGTISAVKWRLIAQDRTGIYDSNAEDIAERLANNGSKSVIQLAELSNEMKAVIVAVIMRKILNYAGGEQRRKKRQLLKGDDLTTQTSKVAPRIWVLIDEAQLVCPSDGKTAASDVAVDFVKRGRDAGLSLVLATQQPSALDINLISQSDTVIAHKLTVETDIRAAVQRMPARGPSSVNTGRTGATDISNINDLCRELNNGESVYADSESNRSFIMESRPRISPHGGGEPLL